MSIVEVRDLTKIFGEVPAVDHLDLATEKGEYLVLLGPSGCGKTTLLRLIAGLEQPTSGEIYIAGEPVAGLPPRVRKIAMVFQSYALYPHKTVFENIEFPLKGHGMSKEQRREKVEWGANLFGISQLLQRKPRQLSGGERQRVALARALVRDPSVFLLDEPLSNLDAKLRTAARDDLKQFQDRVGTTTIYVTHDQVEAMGLGDRIAVMEKGKIRQIGSPVQIYTEPADTFVATFIGSPPMNLVPRDDFTLGFRPEHLIPANGQSKDSVDVRFNIGRIEYLGATAQLHGTVEGLGPETRTIAALPSSESVPTSGETHDFSIERRHLHFFDKTEGIRIDPQRI